MMYTNADITLYSFSNNGYQRTVIENVFYQENEQANILKSGLANVSSVQIFIPYKTDMNFTKGKDLIVKGACNAEIDNTSQQTISQSIKALRESHKVLTLMTVDEKKYGSKDMWHYELGCK